jgi:S1-C subfamily serine protease
LVIVALVGYRALDRVERGFGPAAERLARSVYLIALDGEGGRTAVATAFAVSANGLLATTAHVAAELERRGAIAGDGGIRAVALVTDSESQPLPIVSAYLHPEHESDTFQNDVALLQVEVEELLAPLQLADDPALERLERGVAVGILGFPARATDIAHPRARFVEGAVGDVRGGRYFEIGQGITPGMSGSPIFTRDGRVIGIVVGGELDRSESQGAGNWGLSVAALEEMLEER